MTVGKTCLALAFRAVKQIHWPLIFPKFLTEHQQTLKLPEALLPCFSLGLRTECNTKYAKFHVCNHGTQMSSPKCLHSCLKVLKQGATIRKNNMKKATSPFLQIQDPSHWVLGLFFLLQLQFQQRGGNQKEARPPPQKLEWDERWKAHEIGKGEGSRAAPKSMTTAAEVYALDFHLTDVKIFTSFLKPMF